MRKTSISLAILLGAVAASTAQAQKSATESIEEYRKMLEDGNPADLFEAKGEEIGRAHV